MIRRRASPSWNCAKICEEFATEHIDIMSDQFKRLGVIGDFENPYLTLKP